MQIMSGQSGTLLCGFLITLSMLRGCTTAAYCTSRAIQYRLSSQCHCQNSSIAISITYNASNECVYKPLPHGSLQFDSFDIGPALLYILIDLAPLMIYFPLLILFNVNLAAGPAQSFVFFYQALPAPSAADRKSYLDALTGGFTWGLLTMQSPINDIVFFPILPFIALQYCKLALVAVVTVMTVVLVKCIDCPCASWRRPWAKLRRSVRHFREKHALKGTVLNGLCSIAILTYGFVIQQSFTVLQPANCCPSGARYCSYYCTELEYCSANDCSLAFIPTAALLLVGVFLPLPFLLLYYPCVPALMQHITKRSSPLITCHKLAPVFDVFQSAYKPKLRFFAALPLLYRFVIWMLFSGLSTENNERQRNAILTLIFILILAVHSVFQPYTKPRHNYIEALYLVNLVLISVMYGVASNFELSHGTKWHIGNGYSIDFNVSGTIPVVLAWLPMLVSTGYILCKCNCCKRCSAVCCKRVKRNRRESVEEEDVQVLPSETYLDLDDVDLEQTINI